MHGTGPYSEYPLGYAPLGSPEWRRAMSGALKQTSIVPEAVQGTTPASPGFLILRDTVVENDIQRSDSISPERRSDRATFAMTKGLESFQKTIELPFTRDAATDVLWESAFCSAFGSDVLMNGSDRMPFTLEEIFNAERFGAVRRAVGCIVDEVAAVFPSNGVGQLRFKVRGLAEEAAYGSLDGATYAAPSPGHDPVTPADIQVENLFSISAPRIVAMSLMIRNNTSDRHAWGATAPVETGMGAFGVVGQARLYFTKLAEYAAFMRRQSGLSLDMTIGSVSGARDRLRIFNADVYNPDIDDPGPSDDHMVRLNFVAKHSDFGGGVLALTRNVA